MVMACYIPLDVSYRDVHIINGITLSLNMVSS